MRLRTFTAHDMPTAMKMVRDALGDNAIILATETHGGKKGISLTAAVDPKDEGTATRFSPTAAAIPARQQSHQKTDHLHFEIQNILRFHNIPEHFVTKIMQAASLKELSSLSALHHISANRDAKPLLKLALEKLMGSYFQFAPLSFPSPLEGEGQGGGISSKAFLFKDTPHPNPPPQGGRGIRIMLVGAPGIGKTLTVAKLAARLAMNKQPLAVFTTDNQRAGGVEQLQAFTSILELPLHVAASQTDLARQLKTLHENTQVLIDTAGCNPYNADELQELKSLAFQKDIEPVMVLPAGGDSSEVIDIVEAFSTLPIRRLLITRADTARRFGGIVAAAAAHKLTFSNVSSSSSIINSLEPMDGAMLAHMLLRYQLQTR